LPVECARDFAFIPHRTHRVKFSQFQKLLSGAGFAFSDIAYTFFAKTDGIVFASFANKYL